MLLDPSAAKGHVVPNSAELTEEALTLLVAGNDTTANAMILGMYHICRDNAVQSRVEAELDAAFPTLGAEITLERVKGLPYLVRAVLKRIIIRTQKLTLSCANQTATIKEILRCTHPVPGRLPRVVPPEGYQLFDGSFLNPGVSSQILDPPPQSIHPSSAVV
jgi:cytochrome P450